MCNKPYWSLIKNPPAWHTEMWLAFATQEDFFLRIILRRMAHKLRKALGGSYGDCQKVPQGPTKLTEAFKIWMLPQYDQLSFRLIADNSLTDSQNGHTKSFPVADQLCHGEPQSFGEIMKAILSLLSCGQWRPTKLAQHPTQIIYTDGNSIIGERTPVKNPDDISNPCRKMCNLVLENPAKNSSNSLSDIHSLLMLLPCNILRGFGYSRGPLRDFGRFRRYCGGLTCNFAGAFGRSPCQNCHPHSRGTDYRSHYHGPCIPPHDAAILPRRPARANSIPPTHSLIPLWTGWHFATAYHRLETDHG